MGKPTRSSPAKWSTKSSRESAEETNSRRVARVEKEVQLVVSNYINRYLKEELPGLVTIGRVLIPGDLRSAKVFVSLLDPNISSDKALIKEMLHILRTNASEIQNEISHKIQMKYLPKLEFEKDESTEKILHVESMLRSLAAQNTKSNKN
jgi:ribosome-binding factor A